MGTAQTRTCAGLLLGIPGSSRIPSSTKKNIHLLVPQRFAHGPETIFGEAGRISPAKSASVYECLPYIWPYNAQPFLVIYGVSSALSRRFGDYTSFWLVNGRGYDGFTPGAPRVHGRVPP